MNGSKVNLCSGDSDYHSSYTDTYGRVKRQANDNDGDEGVNNDDSDANGSSSEGMAQAMQ